MADGALPREARQRDRPQREPVESSAQGALRTVALPDACRLAACRHERLSRKARRAYAQIRAETRPCIARPADRLLITLTPESLLRAGASALAPPRGSACLSRRRSARRPRCEL